MLGTGIPSEQCDNDCYELTVKYQGTYQDQGWATSRLYLLVIVAQMTP